MEMARASRARNRSPSESWSNRRSHSEGSPNPQAVRRPMASSMPRVGATASIIETSIGKGQACTRRDPGRCRAMASNRRVLPAPDGPLISVIVPGDESSFNPVAIRRAGAVNGKPNLNATSVSRGDLTGRHGGVSITGRSARASYASTTEASSPGRFRRVESRHPEPDRPEDLPPDPPVRTTLFPSARPLPMVASQDSYRMPPATAVCRAIVSFVPMPAPASNRLIPRSIQPLGTQLRPNT